MTALLAGTRIKRLSKSLSVDQDEIVSGSIVQNLPVAGACKPVSQRAFRLRE
jgi:hypothetical protein